MSDSTHTGTRAVPAAQPADVATVIVRAVRSIS